MRRKKKKWKGKREEEKMKKKRSDNVECDAMLWVIEEEELDEVWNLVKEQEKHRATEELKHRTCTEAKEEENKVMKGNEGEQEEEKEVKKGAVQA